LHGAGHLQRQGIKRGEGEGVHVLALQDILTDMSTWGLSDCVKGIGFFLVIGESLIFYSLIWTSHHFQLLRLRARTGVSGSASRVSPRTSCKPRAIELNSDGSEHGRKSSTAQDSSGIAGDF
jgi:hypothetical protein